MKKCFSNLNEMFTLIALIFLIVFITGACDNTGSDIIDEGITSAAPGSESDDESLTEDEVEVDRATFLFSEVKANLIGGYDFIELVVIKSGIADGISVKENSNIIIGADDITGMIVAQGDIIIIHLNSDGSIVNETTSKNECEDDFAYTGAWDVWSTDSGLAATTFVLQLYGHDNSIMDAVMLAEQNGSPSAASVAAASALGVQWTGSGTSFDATIYMEHAVMGLDADDSLHRDGTTDTNSKDDWSVKTESWGAHP